MSGEIGGRGLPGVCKITGFYEFFAKHFCWVGANVCAEGSSLGRMSYIIPLATLLPPFSSDDRYSIDGWIDCRKSIYTHTHMTTDRRKPTLVLPGRRLVAMGRVRRRECETKKYLEVGCIVDWSSNMRIYRTLKRLVRLTTLSKRTWRLRPRVQTRTKCVRKSLYSRTQSK